MPDAVLHWNSIALQAVADDHTPSVVNKPDQGGPTRTSRALAIIHAAIFDAVNVIDGSFIFYLTSIPGFGAASIEAAVAQAAFDTLAALYPKQKETFEAELKEALGSIPDGESKEQGRQVGAKVAEHILDARRGDCSDLDRNCAPTPSIPDQVLQPLVDAGEEICYLPGSLPGQHREDPLNPGQGFLRARWGVGTPFTLNRDGGQGTPQFRSPPPQAWTRGDYKDAFKEVRTRGGDGV